ncbi:MAG TPA: TIGR03663 family protein [Methanocorpusculum sp.]|nr:TIGR03663 family protein [Methanocorpusculum sp.]
MALKIPDKLKPFLRVEVILLLILILAIALRFMFLDLKLFHHDEAIHAWFSYILMSTNHYTYDPVYHGPFLYYVTAGMFSLFGATDFVGRIVPCLFGCGLIPLLYWIYRMDFINKKVVCLASLFIAISPCMLYFSRFLRNDVFIIFFSLLMIAAMLAWMTRKKWYWLVLAGIAAGLGLCCKENMPIIIATFAAFFIYLLWTKKFTLPKNWWKHLLIAFGVFLLVVFTFYSSFWQHPEMLLQAGQAAIEHWFSVQKDQPLGGPAVYYIGTLILYEISLFALAIWGIIRHFRPPKAEQTEDTRFKNLFVRPAEPRKINREREFILFAIVWFITSMIVYAVIGEKVPWLILHQLLPMIIVAAYGLSVLKPKRVFVIGACAIIYLCIVSGCTVYNPCDLCGPIAQVQNSEDLRPLLDAMEEADSVAIVSIPGTDGSAIGWPFTWYFAKEPNKIYYYNVLNPPEYMENCGYDLIITHDLESYENLSGYEKWTQKKHYWFDAINTGGSGIGAVWNWLKYYFTRIGETASLNITVFKKIGADF